MDSRPLKELLKDDFGTYALVLKAKEDKDVQVGKLGNICLHEGYYVYVGSAFGPGGVRSRVGHHMDESNNPHWHVDYIKKVTELVEIWYTYSDNRYEHLWSEALLLCHGASIPYPNFGSTDCRCISHLVFFKTGPSFKDFSNKLKEEIKKEEIPKVNRIEL